MRMMYHNGRRREIEGNGYGPIPGLTQERGKLKINRKD
jgi:hypothetical protein